MSIIDFIKGLFGGETKEEANQSTNVVEEKSVNSDVFVDRNPTLENVARFLIQKGVCKGADIQRYFQIGYKLSGCLMSELQQKGVLDSSYNVLVDANISDQELAQLLSKEIPETPDSHHVFSGSGFEVKIISSSSIDTESSIKPYIPGLSKYESYVVFDTETSGLSPQQGHEILQIGAVKYNTRTGETIDTRSIYIKPSPHCVIEPAALRVNGIDIEKLKQTGVSKDEAINTFIEFIGVCPLFAYNAPFDMRFLKSTCEMVGIPLPTNPVCDILAMVRKLALPTENKKLRTISEHFGFDGGCFHEAIKDCDATNFVLRKIYFNEEGKPVGKSVEDIHFNLHKRGVALEPYIEQNMLELDVYSRLTGEFLFTKTIRQCAEKGIYVSYNTVKDLEETLWTTDYGIRLHEESIGKLEPDIYYGKIEFISIFDYFDKFYEFSHIVPFFTNPYSYIPDNCEKSEEKFFYIILTNYRFLDKSILIKKSKLFTDINLKKINTFPKLKEEDEKYYYKIALPNGDYDSLLIQINRNHNNTFSLSKDNEIYPLHSIYYTNFYTLYKIKKGMLKKNTYLNYYGNSFSDGYANFMPINGSIPNQIDDYFSFNLSITQKEKTNKLNINLKSYSFYIKKPIIII